MYRPTILALLVATLAAGASSTDHAMYSTAADSLGRFPRVAGRSLEGRNLTLPQDFEGALDIVVVAFQRDQQHEVDGWMPLLHSLADHRSDVRVYELPTLGRGYRLMRSFIDGGMRRGIPDRAVRAATVTLYVDKTSFRDALGLRDEDRIYVLLVDRDGRVHWRAEGPFNAATGAELSSRLGKTMPSPGDSATSPM